LPPLQRALNSPHGNVDDILVTLRPAQFKTFLGDPPKLDHSKLRTDQMA
jgi:hypothetical protein